jgi:hypothetical protein
MSTITLKLVSIKEPVTLPSTIFYQDEMDPEEQKTSWCWSCFKTPLQKVGELLRNAFYLPLYNKNISPTAQLDQKLAQKIVLALKSSEVLSSIELEAVRRSFSVRDMDIHLKGSIFRTFTIRLFESKMPIQEKTLRIILFSFNGNTEVQGKMEPRRWNPLTIKALSESSLSVLRALRSAGVRVDSLFTTSLGNVTLDGLKTLSSKEFEIIPPTLIVNRGLTSVQKVANQLYAFPLNYILFGAAKLCGWNANPEQELLHFLKKEAQTSNRPQRKIILIETFKDFYFSEQGRLQPNAHKKIATSGAKVFRANFYPFPFHARSHHALSLDHLITNSVTKILANTIPLNLKSDEPMSSVIARNIFFDGDQANHTCFYVCGNDATLDIGTAREAVPLLSAFIKEGQKMARHNLRNDLIAQNAS